jgi:hypothetical protein
VETDKSRGWWYRVPSSRGAKCKNMPWDM